MSIRIQCPNCQGIVEAREELIGTEALCPFCNHKVRVQPAPQPSQPAPAPPQKVAAPVPPAHVTVAPQPAPAKGLVVGEYLGDAATHRKPGNRLLSLVKVLFQPGNPTDVSIWITGLLSIVGTACVYLALVLPFRGTWVGSLFLERGWVPYAIVWLTVWASAILVFKVWKLATQQSAFTVTLLPQDETKTIHPGNVDMFRHHLEQMPAYLRRGFLVNRVLLGLEHFKARRNAQEAGAMLNTQAEIDAAMVESSYTMLKVFIWAIPILGFIGTVIGISNAVSGFTQAIQAAQDIEVIKTSLGNVTSGLAVAFDTTLIALVFSILIMFPTHSLQKAEDDLLSKVDEYCNEHLLRRLRESTSETTTTGVPASSSSEFKEWLQHMETVETKLIGQLDATCKTMADQLQDSYRKQLQLMRSFLHQLQPEGKTSDGH